MSELIKYEAARRALAEAASFDEVMTIKNAAEHASLYARQAKDTELIGRATEIQVRAQRRAGEMLREAAAAGQRATRQNANPSGTHVESSDMGRPTLAQIGLTRDESSRYQKLAAIPEAAFETAVATARSVAGEVTTAFILQKPTTSRPGKGHSRMAGISDPIDEIPLRQVNELEAATRLFEAVETLATLPYPIRVLKTALPSYQHFHILDNITAAVAALHEVQESWTKIAA